MQEKILFLTLPEGVFLCCLFTILSVYLHPCLCVSASLLVCICIPACVSVCLLPYMPACSTCQCSRTDLGVFLNIQMNLLIILTTSQQWNCNHNIAVTHSVNSYTAEKKHTPIILYQNIHPLNGPLSGTTQVSRYQKGKTNLDFTGARDSEWQWHQLGRMQVCTSLQTDNHASTPPLSFYSPDALSATQTTASKH